MHKLSAISIGDRFVAAHPRQVSLNGHEMPQNTSYFVMKEYAVSPFIRVCRNYTRKGDQHIYTLFPWTPVIFPGTRKTSAEEAETFIYKNVEVKKKRRRIVGYKILIDYRNIEVFDTLGPLAKRILFLLALTKKTEFSTEEIRTLLKQNAPSLKTRMVPMQSFLFAFSEFYAPHKMMEAVYADVPGTNLSQIVKEEPRCGDT